MDRPHILGLGRHELARLLEEHGEAGYRGEQVFAWVHARGVVDPAEMTDLPLALRERLPGLLELDVPPVTESVDGDDQTVKLVLQLEDGLRVEAVLIPRESDQGQVVTTLCVSTQVGCRVGCRFCRSGQEGLVRDLTVAEIVAQVWAARRMLGPDRGLERIVFMGIGEPLDNYGPVAEVIRILSDPRGMGLAWRRFVVSTVGRTAGIRRLGEQFEGKVGLALSLHTLDPRLRRELMGPGAPRVDRVLEAARAYPLGPRDRVTVEIVLVAGLNDTVPEARAMARGLAGLRCRINLIPLNAGACAHLRAPDERTVETYRRELTNRGFAVFVRQRRGDSILAACGQLAFSRV